MAETFQRPGWYPDPEGKPGERWWNGTSWSDSRRGGVQPTAQPTAAAVPVAPIPPVTIQPAAPTAPPPVYSATNPAPARPDPYATQPYPTGALVRGIDTRANRNAMIGFIVGIIALFVGVIPFLSPIAIVFSILGITKARQLKAQGAPSTLMVFALIGLGAGILSGITGLVTLIAFIASITGGSS